MILTSDLPLTVDLVKIWPSHLSYPLSTFIVGDYSATRLWGYAGGSYHGSDTSSAWS